MKRLIALDTSTKSTGYACYEDGMLSYYGAFSGSRSLSIRPRTDEMLKDIYYAIIEYSPDIIVVEMMVVSNNLQTFRELTELVGAIRGMCLTENIEFVELRPTEWRSLVCEPGEKAPLKRDKAKPWSIAKVKKDYGLDVIDDISDAILIGRAYLNQLKDAPRIE